MDSGAVQSPVHENDEQHSPNVDSQQVTHGAEEHHFDDHEKKSVMNRVKARARKIKDTIKKHGQHVLDHGNGNNNEHQHTPDDRDLDEDKEMVEDPKVHGAPIYDSEAVKSATPETEQVENLGKSGINIGGTTVMGKEPHHDPLVEGVSSTAEINQNIATDQAKTFAAEEKPGQYEVNLEGPIVLEEDPQEKGSRPEAYTLPNYQTKVTDPSGAGRDEIKVTTPVEESFERMNVHGQPKPTTELEIQPTVVDTEYPPAEAYTLPNYQTKVTDPRGAESIEIEDIKPVKESFERMNVHEPKPTPELEIQPTVADTEYPSAEAYTLPNYQTKVTDPRGTGRDEIEDITPVEKSLERMNVHDESKPTRESKIQPTVGETEYPRAGSHDQFAPHLSAATETQNEYPQETISTNINANPESDEIEDITPVEKSFERMNVHDEPKPTPEPKIQPTVAETEYPPAGGHDQFVPHLSAATETQNEYPQETISTNTNTNPENRSETGQTFNAITTTVEEQPRYESVETQPKQNRYTDEISPTTADKTLSPESDEASKPDYDEKIHTTDKVTTHDEQQKSGNTSNMSRSTAEYGKNIAPSLTEKLAPIHGKVAEVGSAVKSKVYGTSTGGVGTETKNGVKDHDKGVSSVKDYLAEKLRPGEEDKALSEVISEALHKRKEEPVKEDHGHLGGEDEKPGKAREESSVKSPGKGVFEKVKGVVGSWFAKQGESQSPHGGEDLSENKNSVAEVEQVSQVVDERNIQE